MTIVGILGEQHSNDTEPPHVKLVFRHRVKGVKGDGESDPGSAVKVAARAVATGAKKEDKVLVQKLSMDFHMDWAMLRKLPAIAPLIKDPEYYKKVHGWYRKKRRQANLTYYKFSGLLVPVIHTTSTLIKLSDDLVEEDRPKNNPFLI